MTAQATGMLLQGLNAKPVTVEAHLGSGLVGTTIVGLADTAVRESIQRLRAALSSSKIPALKRRLTINLFPGSVPKNGTGLDLPIAVAVLIARGYLMPEVTKDTVFAAELGLDGSVRPLTEIPALIRAAAQAGFKRLVVAANSAVWHIDTSVEVIGISSLQELLEVFGKDSVAPSWQFLERPQLEPSAPEVTDRNLPGEPDEEPDRDTDLSQLRGQPEMRELLLLAASGGHHLFLHGEPGMGKTLAAEQMVTILPDLNPQQALEILALRSLTGEDVPENTRRPPMQILGPTATRTALLGGGGKNIRPGALSLAHGGVLVINEVPDVAPQVIESLREPLERQEVIIRRAAASMTYPAHCQLVLTANPCPCGLVTTGCRCTPTQKRRYQQRLSAPLMDRIDLHYQVHRPHRAHIATDQTLTSADAREQVRQARQRAAGRWEKWGYRTNTEVPGSLLREFGGLPKHVWMLLTKGVDESWLTMRGADSILRLAWTIADLGLRAQPTDEDVARAIQLRRQDRWGSNYAH